MRDKRAFWDSSAIIPILIHQDASARARQLLKLHPKPVVSWFTSVEINSALARLMRESGLSMAGRDVALTRLSVLETKWVEVVPNASLRVQAMELLYNHELRAADSLQLASALVWCNGKTRSKPFITLDVRLANAAAAVAFHVLK